MQKHKQKRWYVMKLAIIMDQNFKQFWFSRLSLVILIKESHEEIWMVDSDFSI